jgi:hypothetical protein
VDNKKTEERQAYKTGATGRKILSRSFGTEDYFVLINILADLRLLTFKIFQQGHVSRLVPSHNCMPGPQVRKEIICRCDKLGAMPRVLII